MTNPQYYENILLDYERDELLSEPAKSLLRDYYMADGETSPQQAFARAATAFSLGDTRLAERIYQYASKTWFMFSSPILSNAPGIDGKAKSMPISCFLNHVDDNLESIIDHSVETRWLSIMGGGVGSSWSSVRAVSDKSPGPMPFLHTIDADMTAYRQGKTRKGSYAAYMDISHPDIIEFLLMRIPTGDVNRKNLNLHHAVNVTDEFMKCVENNLDWSLIDPHTQEVRETVSARYLWQTILETRFRTGEPYISFIDTINRYMPKAQKDKGMRIKNSNLCAEIVEYCDQFRTAVCCLSSFNLEKRDEWKDTTIVEDLVEYLDNVLTFFIENAPPQLKKATLSAMSERSIGLGVMGFHSYLQKHSIPLASEQAKALNIEIFKDIQQKAIAASERLAIIKGEPDDLIGTGRRNAHLLAIAPNANSSIIAGTSPSIEPIRANAYTQRTRIGSSLMKNKILEDLLIKKDQNTDTVWKEIITNNGSVQHLDFLSEHEKEVFKTATELDMNVIVDLAADRQKYICQSQSLNLFFPPKESKKKVHDVHFNAWKKECKTLYYLRTEASSRTETVSHQVIRNPLKDWKEEECVGCQA